MNLENPQETPADKLKRAVGLAPTEFRCFNYDENGTALTEEDMELKALEPKVEILLHTMLENAVPVEAVKATPEEVIRFKQLLRAKAAHYAEFATLLDDVTGEDR